MTHREETIVLKPGTCRVCGCTHDHRCTFLDPDYPESVDPEDFFDPAVTVMTCWWIDAARTLCSNPHCLAVVPLEELEKVPIGGFTPPKARKAAAG